MSRVAAWAPYSAALAPVALVGGWTVTAALQPPGYDPLRETISALAAHGAAHRWVMTVALAVVGACHLATAAGLRPLRPAPRVLLAVAGVAGIGVAVFPQPADGSSGAHVLCATVSIAALAAWPATVTVVPGRVRTAATLVLGLAAAWLAVALTGGPLLGLAERALTGVEALGPLGVVLALRRTGLPHPAPVESPARMSG